MFRNEPEGVREILAKLTSEKELGRQFNLAQIWDRWPEVAGPALSVRGYPYGVRDNTLLIAVESPAWMHRFAYEKWKLLERINRLTGEELVSDLYFLLEGDAPLPPLPDDEADSGAP